MKTALISFVCVWLGTTINATAQGITFNVLDQCSDMSQLDAILRIKPGPILSCRAPNDALESKLMATAGPNSCLLREAPFPSAIGFSCLFQRFGQTTGGLSCFRIAPDGLIDDYKANYLKKYSGSVSDYIDRSSKCATSNHDASFAISTELYGPLLNISKFEFGVTVGLGSTLPADGIALHGFATSDPQLSNGVPKTLEIIYAFVTDQKFSHPQIPDPKKRDKWRVLSIDDNVDDNLIANRLFANQGAPIRVRVLGFDLTSGLLHASDILSGDVKSNGLRKISSVVVESLSDRDFVKLDENDFVKLFGISSKELLDRTNSTRPYGIRALRGADTMNELTAFFRRNDDCSAPDTGTLAMLTESLSVGAQPGVYGNVGLIFVSAGPCFVRDNTRVERLIVSLKRDIRSQTED